MPGKMWWKMPVYINFFLFLITYRFISVHRKEMVAAELFISAFITVVFEKLASSTLWNLARQKGIASQLETWSTTLSQIQAVLVDAEEKQMTNRAVKQWLDRLQFLAFELDDIVDELATEAIRRHLAESRASGTGTVRNLNHCSFSSWWWNRKLFAKSHLGGLVFDYKMKSKLDKITAKLQELANQKNDFHLEANVVRGSKSNKSNPRLPTTSLVDESRVYGRETDKEKVLKFLLRDESSSCNGEVSVISIVGLGGTGKTTLAQLVYNNEKVKACFDLMVWVSVSEDFDVFKITKVVYESVTQKSRQFEDLNMLQVTLKEKLSYKKFLIVLDDAWNEDDEKWDLLRRPFQVGAPGSKVIVTTRNKGVASTMGSFQTYNLEVLANDDCLSLFAQNALDAPNFDDRPDFKVIGENMVRKCNGLPLALKTLGRLLRTKGSPKEWEYVLNSEIWDLPEDKNSILPALRLSYNHLPSHLKQLFAYCSIFPKDYVFDVYELVLLWMAEGFLKNTKGKKPMEDLGFEYFEELVSRSFFHHLGGSEARYVMHDLMNDLAQFVAGELCFRFDDKVEGYEQHRAFEKARHSSFIRHKYEVFRRFKVFTRARGLRTFLPLEVYKSESENSYYLTKKVVGELLPQLQCLRVLSLSGYSVSELPDSIGSLKHLRYLDLSKSLIKQLPETVSRLHNLQTLTLKSCSRLRKLPTSIGELVSLRHLDITDTDQLQEMPLGISKLTCLQKLSKIVLGKRDGLRITELRDLSDLRGTLAIVGLQNLMSGQDARDANLLFKQGLDDLSMIWVKESYGSRNEGHEYKVLDLLEPHTNVRKLEIMGYGGTTFPSWVGDPSFSKIEHLTLNGCINCTSLPSVGQLPSLKNLSVFNINRVKNVGLEFYGAGRPEVVAFPSLETLRYENMESWEEWSSTIDTDENVVVFPCLHELMLVGCLKLVNLSLPRLPSLRSLYIIECCEVVLRRMVIFASVTELLLKNVIGLSKLHEGTIRELGALKNLRIEGCNQLRHLWQGEVACHNIVNLVSLEVRDCPQLVSLAEEEQEQVLPPNLEYLELYNCINLEKLPNWCNSLTSLKDLIIRGCPKLESFPLMVDSLEVAKRFHQLERIKIQECSSLKSFPTGQKLPTTVKLLHISDCTNLEPDSEEIWLLNNINSSLICIEICGWLNMKTLPKHLLNFVHLTILVIAECPGLDSIPEKGLTPNLRIFEIRECENLKHLPYNQMQSLSSLEHFLISSCPNLKSYPQGRWPPNLKILGIGDLKKPVSEWGLQGLPSSLDYFYIIGRCLELVSFSKVGNLLPSGLTKLHISKLVNLESLSVGLQHLTSLEVLWIRQCPKLRSLPVMVLPTLSNLEITGSPLLRRRCLKEKGDYWPRIDHIPCVDIDNVLIHEE